MALKPWLLILDDDIDVAEVAADYLGRDFQVACAHTIHEAREALHTMGKGVCCVAVIDMRLTEGTEGGLTFAQELRRQTHPPEIVIFTAFANLANADLCMEVAAFGYIAKENGATFPTLRTKCRKASARWHQRWHRLPETQFNHPVAILYGDTMASTELWEALGDQEARRVKSLWRETVSRDIETREGTIVQCTDDWFVAIFTADSAAMAVAAALETAVALPQSLTSDLAPEIALPLQPREVVYWDTVVQVQGREHGQVDMTSPAILACFRIAEKGQPGQILVSQHAREAVGTSTDFDWQEYGTHRVKDMREPVLLYELQTAAGALP